MFALLGCNSNQDPQGLYSKHAWNLCTIKDFGVGADHGPVMPSLYFCQPHAQNQGMLRAIVSFEDCKYLVRPEKMTYVGEQFPRVCDGSTRSADFAVLGV